MRALLLLTVLMIFFHTPTSTASGMELIGQAIQINNPNGWDYLKLELLAGGKSLNYPAQSLFYLLDSHVAASCEKSPCRLLMQISPDEFQGLGHTQRPLVSGGWLIWNPDHLILSGLLTREEIDWKTWAKHPVGKAQEIHLNDYAHSVVGKSVKYKTEDGKKLIYWEIDYSLVYKRLTEFIPVP